MTSVLKTDRRGKSASKRPKKKNHSEGIKRLQKVPDSVNVEQEADINPPTSTPAGLDENGISPAQDTTLRITTNRSGHALTLLENRGTSALSVSPKTSGHTNLEAQSSLLSSEGFNNDTINARGFSRLSGLSYGPHLIYPGMMLTCLNQSTEQLKLLPLVKQRLRFSQR